MKRSLLSTIALGSALVSIATVYSTDLLARDKSSQGASVSAGGVSVSAGRGGASVSSGGASVSADRGGASVSAGGASVSADRGGASVSTGGASVSADRGGASVSTGGASVSAERGGGSVSTGGASVSADRGDADVGREGDRKAPAMHAAARGRPVGDRSYDSIGEWFEDLRTSWFGGMPRDSDVATEEMDTTAQASATQTTEASESHRTQVKRVTQRQSSTEIATDGGSASAEASNVSEIEQNN